MVRPGSRVGVCHVKVSFGKAQQGLFSVRQSCLGTVSRSAVRIGEAVKAVQVMAR